MAPFEVRRVSLRFANSELEGRFLHEYRQTYLRYWRFCHVLSVLFFGVYVVLRALTFARPATAALVVGFGIVAPMFGLGLGLTFTRTYERYWQQINAGYVVVTGLGALYLAVHTAPVHRFLSLVAFIFCYLFGFLVIRLRFLPASLAGTVLTVAYLLVAGRMAEGDQASLWLGLYLVFGVHILGMLAAYFLELHSRKEFHGRLVVEVERQRVALLNAELEARVEERTQDLAERCDELAREIAQRRQAEAERESLAQQMQQAQRMESIGRLAGGVAHDFNNLLTVINGYTEIVEGALSADDPLLADVQNIATAGDRAAVLTRQLLAFSRKQVLEPRVLSFAALLGGVEQMLRSVLGAAIAVESHIASDLGNVVADPAQLEQVLMNLLFNARDAMPDGGSLKLVGENIEVDDTWAAAEPDLEPGAYVRVSVGDTGVGMSAELRSKIFEPFFTTKAKGRGTGLGLATVYGIIKQSGGAVLVESVEGEGSTFSLYLPQTSERPQDSASGLAAVSRGGGERILVIEDEEQVRALAGRMLKAAGYTVIAASNPVQAHDALEKTAGAIDLILSDVVMPEMDGPTLVAELLSRYPGPRVLYMSGYTDDALAAKGILEEGTVLLRKPFKGDALLSSVRELLDR